MTESSSFSRFQSDAHHNTEEMICLYLSYTTTFTTQEKVFLLHVSADHLEILWGSLDTSFKN